MKHPARVAQGGSSWLSLLGMASGGSLTGLRGLYWNASRGPSEFPALARHTPPRSSRPHAAGHGRLPSLCRRPARRALQRLGHLQRRRGPSHGATPAVERDGPQPHALVAAGGGRRGPPLRRPGRAVDVLRPGVEHRLEARHNNQAHGTHRDAADGFLASRSPAARWRCDRLRPRGRTRSRKADRPASTPWSSRPGTHRVGARRRDQRGQAPDELDLGQLDALGPVAGQDAGHAGQGHRPTPSQT